MHLWCITYTCAILFDLVQYSSFQALVLVDVASLHTHSIRLVLGLHLESVLNI